MAQATTLFDVSDRPAFTIFKEQRIEVPLSKVSPNLIKAVVSVEDQRFFDHSGVDAVRIVGAVLANVQAGRRAEGGSTITQQLARQSFLTPRQDLSAASCRKSILAARHRARCTRRSRFSSCTSTRCISATGCTASRPRRAAISASTRRELTVAEAALLAGPGEVAVELRADGQPRSRGRAPQRRAAGDARRPARSTQPTCERARKQRRSR